MPLVARPYMEREFMSVAYSVRSAQTAVYPLLKLEKEVSPPYKGEHAIQVVLNFIKTMLK
jgi:oleate hydratase